MTKWEYLMLHRVRNWQVARAGEYWQEADCWKTYLAEEGGEVECETPFQKLIAQLGEEGWELTGISPRSDFMGTAVADIAGFTSTEVWVFKRPVLE
jgi:hypothetical protein